MKRLLEFLSFAVLVASDPGAVYSKLVVTGHPERSDRYSGSADFQSAVSPSCTRQGVGSSGALRIAARRADLKSAIQQSATLRYGAVPLGNNPGKALFAGVEVQRPNSRPLMISPPARGGMRSPRSADFQSAVSPSCTRQSVGSSGALRIAARLADLKSAIQQSATLPYGLVAVKDSSAVAEISRPNIILLLADDLGVNDLRCYGRKDHRTPNLDRLASEGMRFTSAYCAQPICSPSRAALLSGKTPARLHLTTFLPGRPDCPSQKLLHPAIRQQFPLEEKTLAEHLKEAGYQTACVGKWHLGGKGFLPTDQGFDFYHPGQAVTKPSENEGSKGEFDLTRKAEEFLEANASRPFFLYLPHNSPHIPFSAHADSIKNNSSSFNPVYAAVIEKLDDSVGRLMKKLDALGLRTNTIVIFTSDNGGLHVPEGGHQTITHNSPFRAGKGFLYEGGLRIPLIVRWPGRISPRVIDQPVINTDWLPTLLELAGLPSPRGLDGSSFAALLRGKKVSERSFLWHFPHYNNQGGQPAGAIREGRWKLIEHYDDGRLELFDLSKDPGEKRDLISGQRNRANHMQKKLAAWRKEVGAQTNSINPDFNPQLHRALYQEIDASRFEPEKASEEGQRKILEWRKQMNAAVPRKI